MKHLLELREFCEKYNVREATLSKAKDRYKDGTFVKSGKYVYVDEKEIALKKEEQKRTWNYSHDIYYYLTYVLGVRTMAISKALSSIYSGSTATWNTFFSENLFFPISESVVEFKITRKRAEFIEFGEYVIPKIHKKLMRNKTYTTRLKELI